MAKQIVLPIKDCNVLKQVEDTYLISFALEEATIRFFKLAKQRYYVCLIF